MGWEFRDVSKIPAWFFHENLPRLVLSLPCDPPEQTKFLLHLVEKRTFRKVTDSVRTGHTFHLFGTGFGTAGGLLPYLKTTIS